MKRIIYLFLDMDDSSAGFHGLSERSKQYLYDLKEQLSAHYPSLESFGNREVWVTRPQISKSAAFFASLLNVMEGDVKLQFVKEAGGLTTNDYAANDKTDSVIVLVEHRLVDERLKKHLCQEFKLPSFSDNHIGYVCEESAEPRWLATV